MRDEMKALAERFREALSEEPAPTGGSTVLDLAPRVKCDLLAYTGLHCSGELMLVRVQPRGEAEGSLDGATFQSLMLAGPYGTRVILAAGAGDDGREHPWRAIVLTEGHAFVARTGKPAVRIPDLDTLDRFDAHRAADDVRESYPFAASPEEGTGWTYGRPGPLRNRVRRVIVDKV